MTDYNMLARSVMIRNMNI